MLKDKWILIPLHFVAVWCRACLGSIIVFSTLTHLRLLIWHCWRNSTELTFLFWPDLWHSKCSSPGDSFPFLLEAVLPFIISVGYSISKALKSKMCTWKWEVTSHLKTKRWPWAREWYSANSFHPFWNHILPSRFFKIIFHSAPFGVFRNRVFCKRFPYFFTNLFGIICQQHQMCMLKLRKVLSCINLN